MSAAASAGRGPSSAGRPRRADAAGQAPTAEAAQPRAARIAASSRSRRAHQESRHRVEHGLGHEPTSSQRTTCAPRGRAASTSLVDVERGAMPGRRGCSSPGSRRSTSKPEGPDLRRAHRTRRRAASPRALAPWSQRFQATSGTPRPDGGGPGGRVRRGRARVGGEVREGAAAHLGQGAVGAVGQRPVAERRDPEGRRGASSTASRASTAASRDARSRGAKGTTSRAPSRGCDAAVARGRSGRPRRRRARGRCVDERRGLRASVSTQRWWSASAWTVEQRAPAAARSASSTRGRAPRSGWRRTRARRGSQRVRRAGR